MNRILVVFGTRPEAIKLCPLIRYLRDYLPGIGTLTCVTGQHRELLDQVLASFGIVPDYDLNLMQAGQSLSQLTARMIGGLESVFCDAAPSVAVVQGDTSTTLCGALSAFYAGVPVAHVEAGLRTGNPAEPFPEEMNRVLTTRLARAHFAPTARAAAHLLGEGIEQNAITITGNTGIDALFHVTRGLDSGDIEEPQFPQLDPSRRLVLVTTHRRESFGKPLEQICTALGELARRPDVQVVFPVHPNPQVRAAVEKLPQAANIVLTDPLGYVPFVALLRKACLVLTDSGGIQEEAPSLGKPVLVLRETTERPEALEAGTVRIVGSDTARIVAAATELLDNPEQYSIMARAHNPYGDGAASARIAPILRRMALG